MCAYVPEYPRVRACAFVYVHPRWAMSWNPFKVSINGGKKIPSPKPLRPSHRDDGFIISKILLNWISPFEKSRVRKMFLFVLICVTRKVKIDHVFVNIFLGICGR